MVQAMDHEAVERYMDEEAVEGAVDGASDGWSDGTSFGSGSSRTNVLAMDQGVVEGEIWIRKLSKERWMVRAMKGAMDGTSDRSRSSRRRYG